MSLDPTTLLAAIPAGLRDPLFETYREIASNFAEHRWEPAELNGGKFCECVHSILHGYLSGAYSVSPAKPRNMKDACNALENTPATGKPGDHSARILLPRTLPALYDIRNNRGVGHVGGDVNPNMMDATVVYSLTSWVMAELVRMFHGVSPKEAQETVDALSERKLSLVWEPGTTKRVLDDKMGIADQTLLLLHQSTSWVDEKELCSSVEYSSASMYRKNILQKLHSARMIEYDATGKRARISPKGGQHVEFRILGPRLGWAQRV